MKKNLRKLGLVLTAIVLIASLVSCGGGGIPRGTHESAGTASLTPWGGHR